MEETQGKTECVGSLLVHSSDLQELSTYKTEPEKDPNVCVGSLIMHVHDVQELDTDHIPFPQPSTPVEDLKKRTAVGSLLLPPVDLKTPTTQASSLESPKFPSLVRRFTDKMQGPAPEDGEADCWAD